MKLIIALFITGALVAQCLGRSIKCDCDCKSKPPVSVCAKDPKTGDTDTFLNMCHMQCFNCTHSKNYYIIHQGDCNQKKGGRK